MFTPSQREGILAQARANIAKREPVSSRQPELTYKTRDNAAAASAPSERGAAVASESELPWWEWVDQRMDCRLDAHNEAVGTAMGEYCAGEIAPLKRELDLLLREVTQLREQVGLERGLRDLRSEVEHARAEVPKLPAIAARLEAGQTRLEREVKTTREKLSRVRVDQSIADYRLSQLSKATAAARLRPSRFLGIPLPPSNSH